MLGSTRILVLIMFYVELTVSNGMSFTLDLNSICAEGDYFACCTYHVKFPIIIMIIHFSHIAQPLTWNLQELTLVPHIVSLYRQVFRSIVVFLANWRSQNLGRSSHWPSWHRRGGRRVSGRPWATAPSPQGSSHVLWWRTSLSAICFTNGLHYLLCWADNEALVWWKCECYDS